MTATRRETQTQFPRAEIDLAALERNVAMARTLAGEAGLMAVVKADAYGHGVDLVVPILARAGVESYAVSSVEEGIRLRKLGVSEPILVFTPPVGDELGLYVEHDLDVSIVGEDSLKALLSSGASLRAHLKVDTGMHRLGLTPRRVPQAVEAMRNAGAVELVAAWTHLATADQEDLAFAREQLRRFDDCVGALSVSLPTHVANSAALARLPEAVQGRAFVRPGGLLFGVSTSRGVEEAVSLVPVMRLIGRVVHVMELGPGETVSYGRTWQADRETVVATVAAGYADGVPRHLSNRGVVGIHGRRHPIVGNVCMDMLMVDVGPLGEQQTPVAVGDRVVLFGEGGPSLLELAEATNAMPYTFTVGMTARVPKMPTGKFR